VYLPTDLHRRMTVMIGSVAVAAIVVARAALLQKMRRKRWRVESFSGTECAPCNFSKQADAFFSI
jgi:hypothetical protein